MVFAFVFIMIILYSEKFLFPVSLEPHSEDATQGQGAEERIQDQMHIPGSSFISAPD